MAAGFGVRRGTQPFPAAYGEQDRLWPMMPGLERRMGGSLEGVGGRFRKTASGTRIARARACRRRRRREPFA